MIDRLLLEQCLLGIHLILKQMYFLLEGFSRVVRLHLNIAKLQRIDEKLFKSWSSFFDGIRFVAKTHHRNTNYLTNTDVLTFYFIVEMSDSFTSDFVFCVYLWLSVPFPDRTKQTGQLSFKLQSTEHIPETHPTDTHHARRQPIRSQHQTTEAKQITKRVINAHKLTHTHLHV